MKVFLLSPTFSFLRERETENYLLGRKCVRRKNFSRIKSLVNLGGSLYYKGYSLLEVLELLSLVPFMCARWSFMVTQWEKKERVRERRRLLVNQITISLPSLSLFLFCFFLQPKSFTCCFNPHSIPSSIDTYPYHHALLSLTSQNPHNSTILTSLSLSLSDISITVQYYIVHRASFFLTKILKRGSVCERV